MVFGCVLYVLYVVMSWLACFFIVSLLLTFGVAVLMTMIFY